MRRRQSRPRFCGGCLHGRSRAADGRAEANATDVRCPDDGRVRTRGAWRSRGADPLNNAAYSIRSARRSRQGRARSAEARPRMAGRRSALDDAAVTCRRRPRCRSRCRRRCATHADASFPAGPTDEPACRRATRFATQTGTSRAESSSMISPRTRSHTLAHARASIEARIESGQFDRRGAQPRRRATRIQRVLRRRFRFAPGHDGRRDAGTQRLTSARAVKRIARVDPYRKVGAKGGREAASHRCRTTCLRDCATALHSTSAGIALARRARSPQGQRQRPRRADERRAARCGGDPSRREMHGMRMGRL